MASLKNILLSSAAVAVALAYSGCSKDEEAFQPNGGWQAEQVASQGSARGAALQRAGSVVIDFESAPAAVMAGPTSYGENYYSASAAGHQVTTGYFAKVVNDTYVQFPVNYIQQEFESKKPWRYEYWNGGTAISNFTNLVQGDYKNQMSVYNAGGGHSGKKFGVCYGYSDFYNDPSASYDKCTKIYLTDENGYRSSGGEAVSGTPMSGQFKSVWVSNTTYAYIVMRDGNEFTQGSLASKNGWFKVIFRAKDANGKILPNKVEYYLANFDPKRKGESGLDNKIREGWNRVDLSSLGRNVSTLIVNFEGSDKGNYGLNTPAYVAIDDLEVAVNK